MALYLTLPVGPDYRDRVAVLNALGSLDNVVLEAITPIHHHTTSKALEMRVRDTTEGV